MAEQPSHGRVDVSKPGKRIRWATQRVGTAAAKGKRSKIMSRLSIRGTSNEKKRESGGSNSSGVQSAPLDGIENGSQTGDGGRQIFFNMPLPPEAKDEDGKPLAHYKRNKIRTAKYTPLTFVPKNLWFQFHNIANVYFLSLIVLGVSIKSACCCFIADQINSSLQYLGLTIQDSMRFRLL